MPTIDGDAHVMEGPQTWADCDPSERKFMPVLLNPGPDADRQFWLIDGKIRGHVRHVVKPKDFQALAEASGRDMVVSPEAQHLEDVQARLRHMDETTRRFIRERTDVVRRYIKSHIEAVHRFKTDRETSIKVLAKALALSDKQLLERTYDGAIAEHKLPAKQYPTLEGLKTILTSDPKAKGAKAEDFVDVRFITELDESGYIDKLYRRTAK
jgi:hypothetical protein